MLLAQRLSASPSGVLPFTASLVPLRKGAGTPGAELHVKSSSVVLSKCSVSEIRSRLWSAGEDG